LAHAILRKQKWIGMPGKSPWAVVHSSSTSSFLQVKRERERERERERQIWTVSFVIYEKKPFFGGRRVFFCKCLVATDLPMFKNPKQTEEDE